MSFPALARFRSANGNWNQMCLLRRLAVESYVFPFSMRSGSMDQVKEGHLVVSLIEVGWMFLSFPVADTGKPPPPHHHPPGPYFG